MRVKEEKNYQKQFNSAHEDTRTNFWQSIYNLKIVDGHLLLFLQYTYTNIKKIFSQ